MADDKETTAVAKRDLPEAVVERGIDKAQWNTLKRSLYPGADDLSILLVIDYCRARKLDPMKKPCHIVPMQVWNAKTRSQEWRDVVLPGIYEYRTTAQRTGEYLGHSEPTYGPDVETFGVEAPEWCSMTIFRWNTKANAKCSFPVTVYFEEACGTKKDRESGTIKANARWARAPRQMLTKCCEAAGLREAFPEEIGGEPTAEEMEGQPHVDGLVVESVTPAAPSPFEQLPEVLRDKVEKAFHTLGLAPGQRTVKLAEYLGSGGDLEAAAERMLEWCRTEWKRRQKAPAAEPDNSHKPNRKAKPAKAPEPKADVTPPAEEIFDATPAGELF